MSDEPKDIFENIDHMVELLTQQIEQYRKLKRCLRIAELVGIPPKDLKGQVRFGVVNLGGNQFRPWTQMVARVTIDGVTTDYPLKDVHKDLWPEDTRAAYERWMKHRTRKGD